MTGEVVIAPENNWPHKPAGVIRGDQVDLPLNVAFVGGGKACYDLLQMLDDERLLRLKMKILGVTDVDSQAPGLVYAKKHKLFTSSNFQGPLQPEGIKFHHQTNRIDRSKGGKFARQHRQKFP